MTFAVDWALSNKYLSIYLPPQKESIFVCILYTQVPYRSLSHNLLGF